MVVQTFDCTEPYEHNKNFESEKACLHCVCNEQFPDLVFKEDLEGSEDETDVTKTSADDRNDGTDPTDRKESLICKNGYLD